MATRAGPATLRSSEGGSARTTPPGSLRERRAPPPPGSAAAEAPELAPRSLPSAGSPWWTSGAVHLLEPLPADRRRGKREREREIGRQRLPISRGSQPGRPSRSPLPRLAFSGATGTSCGAVSIGEPAAPPRGWHPSAGLFQGAGGLPSCQLPALVFFSTWLH
ncbi:hypothetical protein E2320_006318 [Naja naja]|nr:hypothetical protein E2320_006318 [Naja naja]